MLSVWNESVSCCMATTKTIHLIDFFVLLIALSLFAAYVRILHNSTTILIIISTLDISVLLVRIIDFLDFSGRYDFGPTLQNSIKMICFSMVTLSLFNLLSERTLALYAYQWYGLHNVRYDRPESARPHVIIMVYLLQLIFVLICFRFVQNGGASAAQLYVAVLFGCAIVALVVTMIYILSARLRQNCVRKRRFEYNRHSIAGQYQMIENQRCDRVIALYIPFQVLSFFLTTILGGVLIFRVERRDPRSYLLFHSLLYLTIAPRVMLSMLIPLTRHPALYKQFKHLLSGQKRFMKSKRRSSKGPEHYSLSSSEAKYVVVHSTAGKPLTFAPEREAALYFENYTAAWGWRAEWKRNAK